MRLPRLEMPMSEVSKYVSISPASDWFFVYDGVPKTAGPTVWRLAAWGLQPDGAVIGLIGAFGHQQGGERKAPSLIQVPPVPGEYLHWSQLDAQEQAAATKR
ncbi:methionyl-tRNA formyltransferase [Xanthomonas oryzae pv. oryzae]|nr:methionyl-tRNA formyltransferase [Xanthomonas oryzae pv. oryzae]QBN62565.1 methionyl-tRNA formyltransferase [Xanthomonas oryzae pv. oryzae]